MLMGVLSLVACASAVAAVGQRFPASKGEVWPLPEYSRRESRLYMLTKEFRIKLSNHSCPLINKAVKRYEKIYLQPLAPAKYEITVKRKFGDKVLNKLDYLVVVLTGKCEDWPYVGMDEKYRLVVSARSKLSSASVWGILRGLESFAHLIYLDDDYKKTVVRATEIRDYPNYRYRGLLLDTARHFIPVDKILMTLAAMAMNKMNVFHWHLINDESFSLQSKKHPELSERGAYFSTLTYTAADATAVTEYARERGIVVIPEIQLPGHCGSIARSHRELFPNCDYMLGPLDPLQSRTHELAADLMTELQQMFPTNHIYLGAMNVAMNCWKDDFNFRAQMAAKNLTVQTLLNMTYQNIIKTLKPGTVPIVWQDLWERHYPVPNNSIFNVYRKDGIHDIIRILKDGYRGILSMFYNTTGAEILGYNRFYMDPLMYVHLELKNTTNMMGAELMIWTKDLDEANIITRVWPSAIGFAEVMWGMTWFPEHPADVGRTPTARAEEQACRMRRRGVPAQPPIGPSFCLA